MKEVSSKDYSRLIREGLDFDSEAVNTKYKFDKMSKFFGLSYLTYLKAAFEAKNDLTVEDFCRINGEVPQKFLERFK